jgi:hypothetical protein
MYDNGIESFVTAGESLTDKIWEPPLTRDGTGTGYRPVRSGLTGLDRYRSSKIRTGSISATNVSRETSSTRDRRENFLMLEKTIDLFE